MLLLPLLRLKSSPKIYMQNDLINWWRNDFISYIMFALHSKWFQLIAFRIKHIRAAIRPRMTMKMNRKSFDALGLEFRIRVSSFAFDLPSVRFVRLWISRWIHFHWTISLIGASLEVHILVHTALNVECAYKILLSSLITIIMANTSFWITELNWFHVRARRTLSFYTNLTTYKDLLRL